MSTQLPEAPTHAPFQPKPKAKRKWLMPVLLAVALLAGLGIGSAKPAPPPVTIEKPVDRPVDRIVEKKVEVTPASCLTALTLAGQVNDISADTIGILVDTLKAAGRLDAATISANTPKVQEQTAKLSGISPQYLAARDSCRASAK